MNILRQFFKFNINRHISCNSSYELRCTCVDSCRHDVHLLANYVYNNVEDWVIVFVAKSLSVSSPILSPILSFCHPFSSSPPLPSPLSLSLSLFLSPFLPSILPLSIPSVSFSPYSCYNVSVYFTVVLASLTLLLLSN